MAWVTYGQIGLDGGEDLKRELRILHRLEDKWKIGCVVMMESTVEQAELPLMEIDEDAASLFAHIPGNRLTGMSLAMKCLKSATDAGVASAGKHRLRGEQPIVSGTRADIPKRGCRAGRFNFPRRAYAFSRFLGSIRPAYDGLRLDRPFQGAERAFRPIHRSKSRCGRRPARCL